MLAGCRLPDRREKCACPPGFAGGRPVRAVNAYRTGSSIPATHLLYGRTTLAPRRACQRGAPLDRASAVERRHAPAACARALHLIIYIFARRTRFDKLFPPPKKRAREFAATPSRTGHFRHPARANLENPRQKYPQPRRPSN